MKKIVKLSTKEILDIISSTGYNKRRLFNFTFSDEDVAPLMTDTYKGYIHRNLGEFIARRSIANDEYLKTVSGYEFLKDFDFIFAYSEIAKTMKILLNHIQFFSMKQI